MERKGRRGEGEKRRRKEEEKKRTDKEKKIQKKNFLSQILSTINLNLQYCFEKVFISFLVSLQKSKKILTLFCCHNTVTVHQSCHTTNHYLDDG